MYSNKINQQIENKSCQYFDFGINTKLLMFRTIFYEFSSYILFGSIKKIPPWVSFFVVIFRSFGHENWTYVVIYWIAFFLWGVILKFRKNCSWTLLHGHWFEYSNFKNISKINSTDVDLFSIKSRWSVHKLMHGFWRILGLSYHYRRPKSFERLGVLLQDLTKRKLSTNSEEIIGIY